MVRPVDKRVTNDAIRPVEPVSRNTQEVAPVARGEGFIRGTKGIRGEAGKVNASRFGDPVTNFASELLGTPTEATTEKLAEVVKRVYAAEKRGT